MLARATRMAAVVGTILVVINQGTTLLREPLRPGLLARVALTFAVPFCVSLYSMVGMVPELRAGERSAAGGLHRCRTCPGSSPAHAEVGPGAALPSCPRCGRRGRWVRARV